MYSAIQVAKFFISRYVGDKNRGIEPIKLQKLVYISYGWCWAALEKELFPDEIQAWKYGPVIPAIWNEFKDDRSTSNYQISIESLSIEKEIEELLEKIYNVYIKEKSALMVSITYAPGTPWSLVYDGGHDKEIPKHVIRYYFEALYEERQKNNITG